MSGGRSPWRVSIVIFLTAFILRIALVLLLKTYIIAPGDGLEMRNVAQSLADGHGYSSPFGVATGPTAWAAPLFPVLLAICFKLFGSFTVQSAIAIRVLNCLFSAVSCVFVYLAAKLPFGERVATIASLVFVVYPASIWAAIWTTWDTTLLTLLLLVAVYLLTRLYLRPGAGSAVITGVAFGVVLLDNVAPLLVLPLFVLWYFWRARLTPGWLPAASMLAAIPSLIFGPWVIRNYIATGSLVARCCAGLELRVGNNEGSWERKAVTGNFDLHPAGSAAQAKLYSELGEKAYDRYAKDRALSFIRDNPGKLIDLTLWRIGGWWLDLYTGPGGPEDQWTARVRLAKRLIHWVVLPFLFAGVYFAIRNRNYLSYPYLILVFVYPLPYYFFSVAEHMRFPVESFGVTLACYGALAATGSLDKRKTPQPPGVIE